MCMPLKKMFAPVGIRPPPARLDRRTLLEVLARLAPAEGPRPGGGPEVPAACLECLGLVASYLLHWVGDRYWDVIGVGGVRGMSLFLHERAELDWYFDHYAHTRLNPFVAADQIAGYESAHFAGLLAEHTYLQEVTREEGLTLPLHALVVANPHGDVYFDWVRLESSWLERLPQGETRSEPKEVARAKAWYQGRGFRRV